jgi:serine/threonine protein kinase
MDTCCPSPELLRDFLIGSSTETVGDSIEEHLAGCPSCVRRLAGLDARDPLVELVRAGAQVSTAVEEADGDLLARLCRLRLERRAGLARSGAGSMAIGERLQVPLDFLEPPEGPGELGRIGPYRIEQVLGAGGMGIVFRAQQLRPHRTVALKIILAGSCGGERVERSRRESEMLARLRHAHIVQVIAAGEHAGRPYFTMDYAAGGNLVQKLAVAPLPARTVAELLQTLARAVECAHVRGVVHRDLKPSNVLLRDEGRETTGESHSSSPLIPYPSPLYRLIGDFGLAKDVGPAAQADSGQTTTGAIVGTPSYMAPEQAGGQSAQVGPATDVYALGAILYECLTGRPPFRAASILDTLEQVRTQEPVPPSRLQLRLPRDLQTICLKCLTKEPARRYESAAALADDLERFLAGKPIVARPARWWERL